MKTTAPWPRFTAESKQILQLQRGNITAITDGMYQTGLGLGNRSCCARFPAGQDDVREPAERARSDAEMTYAHVRLMNSAENLTTYTPSCDEPICRVIRATK